MADWKKTVRYWLFADQNPAIRGFTKWYFDLLKNALVVAALVYTWKKTNDAIVGMVAIVTLGMFLAYVVSYPLTVVFMVRPYIQSLSPLRSWMLAVLFAIALAVGTLAIGSATMGVIGAIFHAQGTIR